MQSMWFLGALVMCLDLAEAKRNYDIYSYPMEPHFRRRPHSTVEFREKLVQQLEMAKDIKPECASYFKQRVKALKYPEYNAAYKLAFTEDTTDPDCPASFYKKLKNFALQTSSDISSGTVFVSSESSSSENVQKVSSEITENTKLQNDDYESLANDDEPTQYTPGRPNKVKTCIMSPPPGKEYCFAVVYEPSPKG